MFFLSSGNSVLLFRASFLLLETIIEISWDQFSQKKVIQLAETIFNFFFFFIGFFASSGNVFFNESIIPAIGEGFPLYCEPSTLLESSFLLAKTVTDMSGNRFLETDLVLPSETSFSS